MSLRRARRGSTLVGVLVVLGIIGVIIALLLPQIQRAREAARRNQCLCKMKQLGLALQNYHEVYKKFPATSHQGNADGVASVWWPKPGTGSTTGAIPSTGYTSEAGSTSATAGYSWIVMILPYMDEAPLYNAISEASGEFAADAFTPYNVTTVRDGESTGKTLSVPTTHNGKTMQRHFATLPLDEVACPSFGGTATVAPSRYRGDPPGNPPAAYGYPATSESLGSIPLSAAITNYLALSATHFPCMQYGVEPNLAATTDIPKEADAPNGMIVPGTGLNMKACKDGIAKTLIICETIEPAMNCWYDGTTTWTTGINPNSMGDYPPSKADPGPDGVANPQGFWMVPAGGMAALDVGPSPKSTTAYSPALAGYCASPQVISWGPSSNHSGGEVIHGAADGSVHTVTPDIDPTVYMHIITRAGREPDYLPDAP